MDDLVSLTVVQSEAAAVSLCALLESAGIDCMQRLTNIGAAATGWSAGAPHEILVWANDADLAREVLSSDGPEDP